MNPPRFPLHYPELDFLGNAAGHTEDIYAVLRQRLLFEEFSHPEIDLLCKFMQCYAAPRGAVLLREGDTGNHMLIVLSGSVAVTKHAGQKGEIDIAVVGPGNMLGEMSLFDGKPRFATCTAAEPADFAVLDRADLNEIMLDSPRLANKLLVGMMQIQIARMRDMGQRIVSDLPGMVV